MKTTYFSLIVLIVFLTACEKDSGGDETTTATSSSSAFVLKAPSCLVNYGNVFYSDIYFTYDSQKRLIKQSEASDSIVTTYSYSGNTMNETNTQINEDGSTDIRNTLHYLNSSGMIDSSVEQSSGQPYTTIYQYNPQGYLVRTLTRNSSGILVPVSACTYVGGNRAAEYRINTDWQGQVMDSSIDATYTYYSNMRGAFEEWDAWTSRVGRGNANEMKTISYGAETETHTFTLGPNNLPSKIDVTSANGSYSVSMSWTCH